MPSMPPTFRPAGDLSRREQNRQADRRRGSARERGYDSAWDKAAKGHLKRSPLCRYCALVDEVKAADLVDHFYPHRGDRQLFWNKTYWVSCCGDCHSGFKQRIERKGRAALDALAVRLGLPLLRIPAPS
jgi:5-methylcytosine-specific restriction endonuclease McrA